MPELPEVETVRRGLEGLIIDRTIEAVNFDWPKSFPNTVDDVDQFLIGSTVVALRRRAKVLIVDLSSGYSLVIHLKMTGQVVFVPVKGQDGRFGAGHPNESLINSLPDKSTRVELTFRDGSKLFFNDQRKFGWMKLLPTAEVFEMPFFKSVGPEPLEEAFTSDVFASVIKRRANTSVKAALLDQTVLAGVGNIYADESLWAAGIHPDRRVKSLSRKQLDLLHKELIAVLKLSIEKGGSTNRNYVNAEGKKGSYMAFANVFRREGQACNTCGNTIEKIRVAGRGTHTCPSCQPPRGKARQ